MINPVCMLIQISYSYGSPEQSSVKGKCNNLRCMEIEDPKLVPSGLKNSHLKYSKYMKSLECVISNGAFFIYAHFQNYPMGGGTTGTLGTCPHYILGNSLLFSKI